MPSTTRVSCGNENTSFQYDIYIGHGLFDHQFIGSDIIKLNSTISKFVVITDANLYALYGEKYLNSMFSAHSTKEVYIKVLKPGEFTKCREVKAEIEDWMFEKRCHRDTCMIAFGGGVVGDLTGFIAATYMRGLPFVQIPTSLLACVDSSIGGKTAIDSPAGKNLIGAFHQPQRVYVDLNLLKTLPKREFVNGMAEIIKAGAIHSEPLFSFLENNAESICDQEKEAMLEIVVRSIQIKADVVTRDEKEGGIRAILNFGHSIGHGIEALLQPQYLHGECVAIGMIKEAEIARLLGHCKTSTYGRLVRCIKTYGLPTRVPDRLETKAIIEKMEIDKKNKGGEKRMVMLTGIGSVCSNPYTISVKDKDVSLILSKSIKVIPGKQCKGRVRVPGSKSISNRVLLMSALGMGKCRIRGLLHSDDTQVMINALQIMGAIFEWEDEGDTLVINGTGGKFNELAECQELYFSNAGTAARFMTTCVTLVRAKNNSPIVLTGNYRMKERPIGPLVDALRDQGCNINYLESEGCPPLSIHYTGLRGGVINLSGKISSQYVSSVLISAPYADKETIIQLEEESPTSLPYIHMTIALMRKFGIDVKLEAMNRFVIPKGVYINPPEFEVEVDASSATYPLAIAAISGGEVVVEGLGANSLQGDSNFHKLLRSMGCETEQTDTATTVKAPKSGRLLAVEVDMEDMTDAFMTAVALACVAHGTTKITGISNQRVKECNRIEVMATELKKLGIRCGELMDGIWIEGVSPNLSTNPASIACHNDHRIAMSFGVLGCVLPDVIITDKECTDKTYPDFWDDCRNKLGLELTSAQESTTSNKKIEKGETAVFIIGMRGAGKTTFGKNAALKLGMKFIDMDELLQDRLGCKIKSFVEAEGWEIFRQKEHELLAELVSNPPRNTVISCGGGVVETPSNVQLLSNCSFVVHLQRNINDIIQYLSQESVRPGYDENILSVWKRREPLYTKCSSYDYYADCGNDSFHDGTVDIIDDFVEFLDNIEKDNTVLLDRVSSLGTFFLSLTFGDLREAEEILPLIAQSVNALELRVDLLNSYDAVFILQQISFLRRVCQLPIIFTIRSKNQGGAFDDNQKKIFDLLKLGIRAGCEFIDMECCWDYQLREDLILKKKNCKIISSYHAIQEPLTNAELRQIFNDCYHGGQVDIVKVVIKAYDIQDTYRIHLIAQSMNFQCPYIALCTTSMGKLSRVLNQIMTPVTHPALPAAAAPGQLSTEEIMVARTSLGMMNDKKFYLFGSPIQSSPSPGMHNSGFKHWNLPYEYSLYETEDVRELEKVMKMDNFGGASVTIPHKLSFLNSMDYLTPASQAIGAINTISRIECGNKGRSLLLGDNTDWIGIYKPIKKRLQKMNVKTNSNLVALVVGSGGASMAACYALKKLGVKIYIYNRTYPKAELLSEKFSGIAVKELTPELLPRVDIVIGTIPATSAFILPNYLVECKKDMIVFDAAYKPPITPLLRQAKDQGLICIQGAEILYEQAFEQFSIWTKLRPPRDAMKTECLKGILQEELL